MTRESVTSPKPVGRLELTWTNKHLRLLAQEDGSYEWVEPSDHRVAEVRLLRDAGRVGDPEDDDGPENLLIRGDALHALLSLSALPEYQEKYAGKVRLVYIDPPFNTQQSFLQYDDALEHSVWLTMMRDRLLQVRELLSPEGSVWVHLDDSEQHRARCVLDEVFGPENFVSSIAWQKAHSRRNDAAFVSGAHDVIHVYARNRHQLRLNRLEADEKTKRNYTNPDQDPRGDWISVPFHAPNVRPNLTYPIVGPDGTEHWPPKGRCWSRTREEYERLHEERRIYFGADGSGVPRRKKFWAEQTPTLVPWSWWTRDEVGDNQEATAETRALVGSRDGFSTPKPERLLARVITIGSDPGDIVLDCFAGSGTTPAVAHKLGRRWVAVERSGDTISTFTIPRLRKVVEGDDRGGISEAVGWKDGGSFRIMDVAPSMFAETDGVIMLSDWASNEELSEAVAAQLGFSYKGEASPFCGRKGRCQLAVIDGRVNEAVVELLSSLITEGETMLICATSLDPAARDVLPRGSRLQKIPSSILDRYRRQYRTRRRSELGIEPNPEPTTELLSANA